MTDGWKPDVCQREGCGHTAGDHQHSGAYLPTRPGLQRGVCLIADCECTGYVEPVSVEAGRLLGPLTTAEFESRIPGETQVAEVQRLALVARKVASDAMELAVKFDARAREQHDTSSAEKAA